MFYHISLSIDHLNKEEISNLNTLAKCNIDKYKSSYTHVNIYINTALNTMGVLFTDIIFTSDIAVTKEDFMKIIKLYIISEDMAYLHALAYIRNILTKTK